MKQILLFTTLLLITFNADSQTFQSVKAITFSGPTEIKHFNGDLFFDGNDTIHGNELWQSDGTTPGTQMLIDINTPTNNGSFPDDLIEYNNILYFSARDSAHGVELFKSNGTLAGTSLLKDINPTSVQSSDPIEFTVFNGNLFFVADDGIHGNEIWISDGTTAGTQLFIDINTQSGSNPAELTEYNGKLYFRANNGLNGTELWETDGTVAGTQLYADLNLLGSSSPDKLHVANGKLFFTADNSLNGRELWVADGTQFGYQMLLDINPFNNNSSFSQYVPRDLVEFNGKLLFIANDSIHGEELWITDGTTIGTQLLKDINPSGDSSSISFLEGGYGSTFNGKYYFRANDFINGSEVWVTDGTTAGTYMLANLYSGTHTDSWNIVHPNNGVPFGFTEYNGKLYFSATDSSNRQLWVTDGTTVGTNKILNGAGAGFPGSFTVYNGDLYFTALYNSPGLWKFSTAPTKVNNISESEVVNIYPNPATRTLNVAVGANVKITKISVYEFAGKEVSIPIVGYGQIDIAALPTGLYFIRIETNAGIAERKFIKK